MIDREELLRMHIEEFFDLKPVIVRIPEDADSLAEAFSINLEMPETRDPFKRFLTSVCDLHDIEGLTFLIDAWEGNDKGRTPGANIDLTFFHNDSFDSENSKSSYPYPLLNELDEILNQRQDKLVNIYGGGIYLTTPDLFEQRIIAYIKRVFARDSGPFGVDRDAEEPPSGFVVAVVDRSKES